MAVRGSSRWHLAAVVCDNVVLVFRMLACGQPTGVPGVRTSLRRLVEAELDAQARLGIKKSSDFERKTLKSKIG